MRHTFRCPMRWSDMDAYGHVNNVRLPHLPRGGAGRHVVRPRRRTTAAKALSEGVLVAHHEIDYKRPLVYHPRGVDIEMWVAAIKGASFEIRYEVRDQVTVFAYAGSVLVPYDLTASRPRRVSPEERAFLERYLDTDD